MPASHPFIDVVILDGVRERFAAGDPLVILSTDLEDLLWANGSGASLFGHADIGTAVEAGSGLGPAARRQIMATRGYPAIGRDRSVMVRLTQGVVTFLASEIAMPGGEPAILLALPSRDGDSEADRAARAIGGFTERGHMLALIGGAGEVLAGSAGFAGLDIPAGTLADLADEARGAPARLAKRLVTAGDALLPAGIAHLTDAPARYLLVLVDEDELDGEGAADATPGSSDTPESTEAEIVDAVTASDREAAVAHEASSGADAVTTTVIAVMPPEPSREDGDLPEEAGGSPDTASMPDAPVETEATTTLAAPAADSASGDVPDEDDAVDLDPHTDAAPEDQAIATEHSLLAEPEDPLALVDPASEEDPVTAGDAASEAEAETGQPAPSATMHQIPQAPDRTAPPLRFVWKTDTSGRFSALSPEFAEAVGLSTGDLLGRPFRQVSERLGLDPSGEISALLERRDTWSGRSVLWPLAGSGFRVPVDLAALPIYDRERVFEGFRGFGVARLADAVADPEAATLRLADDEVAPASPDLPVPANDRTGDGGQEPATVAAPESPAQSESAGDPFMGEVPALKIVPKENRRFSDKVIRLSEHRAGTPETGLSPGERVAFREIGDRLRHVDETTAKEETVSASGDTSRLADSPESPADTGRDEAEVPEDIHTLVADDHHSAELDSGLTLTGEALDTADDGDAESQVEATDDDSTAVSQVVAPEELPTVELRATEEALVIADHVDEIIRVTTTSDETREADLGLDLAPEEDSPPADSETDPVSDIGTEFGSDDAPSIEDADRLEAEDSTPQIAADLEADSTPAAETEDADLTAEADEDEAEVPAALVEGDVVTPEPLAEVAEEPVEATVGPLFDTPKERPTIAALAADLAASAEQTGADAHVPTTLDDADDHEAATGTDTTILARLPVPVLIHSGDTLHYANPEFLDLTGYPTLEALNDAGGLGCVFADRYDQPDGEGADHALRLRTSDGHEFPIEALLRSVPWGEGHALMLVVRRSGESPATTATSDPGRDELRAHVAELRTIIDTATDGVIVIGGNGLIRSISRPAEALFGYETDDVAGKPFVSLFAMESQRAARDYLTSLSDHGVASVLNDGREVIGREAQGRFIPMFLSIGKLPNDSGYCAVVRDITPWKRAEEELTQSRMIAERASTQKSDFLARISHEIRTPLNAIIGFSELMVDERFGPIGNDRYRDYLRDINKSGNHVLDLVNDLLDISKIEAGEQEMTYEAVSLNDALAQTVAMMQPQANRDRVIIRSSFASRLPDVVADLRSVRQIALNLLSNAVRYTQAGGQVIVSTAYEPSGDVVIRVRDTGIGMSSAEIEQAMKPFKQINALKGGRNEGTGLGLPLTKAMVEANRARFTINSTPGEGTLVEISFPSTRVLAE